jgi:hypothetical protein
MKDARGRKILVGDTIIYSSTGVHHVTAAEVLKIGSTIKAEVISTTVYGSTVGKEVTLGSPYRREAKLDNVMVIESKGEVVDLTVPLVKPFKA